MRLLRGRLPRWPAAFLFGLWAALVPLEARAGSAGPFAVGLEAYDGGDFAASYAAWLPLAEAGDPEAQVALAGLYADGLGVARDWTAAARWYKAAAAAGDAVAQLNLGDLYSRGLGVPRDRVAAYIWLSRAAGQGKRWPRLRRAEIAAEMEAAELAAARAALAADP